MIEKLKTEEGIQEFERLKGIWQEQLHIKQIANEKMESANSRILALLDNESDYLEFREQELNEEALRATCSLCVLEGRCVCGELDPLEEDEDDFMTDRETFMEENGLDEEDMKNDIRYPSGL